VSAPPALEQVAATYTNANALHTLQEQALLVDRFSTQGYKPGQLTDFMKQDQLEARLNAIHVLSDYSTLVADLALGKREAEMLAKTKSLSAATGAAVKTSTQTSSDTSTKTATDTNTLSTATKLSSTQTNTGSVTGSATNSATTTTTSSANKLMTPQQMNYLIGGLDAAIKPFIHHMVRKRLPVIMEKADPTIQQICSLLSADLLTLKSQAKSDYTILLMNQDQFVQKNMYKFTPLELRVETEKLYQIERDAAKSDSDLTHAAEAVKRLAQAHHELVKEKVHDAE
jgi:hypothetical protein